jgi:hypothetical protein
MNLEELRPLSKTEDDELRASLKEDGQLIPIVRDRDANDHGFRVRHPYAGFEPGDMVSFIHRFREGVARVIWNKPLGAEFETGFGYFEE